MFDYYNLSILLAFQAPFICLVICTHIFFSLRRNGITRKQFVLIRLLIVGCVASMFTELTSGLMMYGVMNVSNHTFLIITNISYGLVLFNTIILGEFCHSSLNKPNKLLQQIIKVVYIFVGICILARFILIDSELFMFFNQSGEISFGPLDDIQIYGCLLANILLLIQLYTAYSDKSEYVNHEKYGKLLSASISVTSFFVLYVVLYIPYIIWIGHMLVIMLLYTNLQSLLIDRDELTSLSNRRRMIKDIDIKINEKTNWSYILSDVNSFKQVNDKFGHNEGDRALKITASVLENVSLRHDSVAYRIGGDEFAMVVSSSDEQIILSICEEIDKELENVVSKAYLPYQLGLSNGYAIYGENGIIEIPNIIELADERMYEQKQKKKMRV